MGQGRVLEQVLFNGIEGLGQSGGHDVCLRGELAAERARRACRKRPKGASSSTATLEGSSRELQSARVTKENKREPDR